MKYNFIKTEVIDYVFTIMLARSEKRNAFTPTMVNEIWHAIRIANENDHIKVVVFRAEGPVFCAGMDIKIFQDPTKDNCNEFIENKDISLGEVMDQLYKPSIAIVEGDVIAGAFLFIANCTYVFARSTVRFRLPELDLGIFPFQVMASLLKVMPEKKMLQLCLETDYFSAQKAKDLGLVDAFLDDGIVGKIIASFEKRSTQVLISGIKALRKLGDISKVNQYAFLKEKLEELKMSTFHR